MSPVNVIKILLVDDQPSVRQGLRMCMELEADLVVVGEAGDGAEAIERIPTLKPDVVVMDVEMPKMDGIAATKRLHEIAPHIAVVILTIHGNTDTRTKAQKAGAKAFVEKQASATDLLTAIRRIAQVDKNKHR